MRVQYKAGTWRQLARLDWFSVIIAEFSLSNFGNYAVLTILSLYFVHTLNLPAAQAGGLMLFTTLSFRFSRVFAAPLLERFSARRSAFVALSLSSLGTLGMVVVKTPLLLALMLLITGTGYSANALLVKTLVARAKSSDESKSSSSSLFLRYTLLTIGVNLAAAVGSVLGSAIFFHWSPAGVFVLAAITYVLSGCMTLLLPASDAGTQSAQSAQPEQLRWGTALWLNLRRPALWRALLFAFMGWFLYTQFYASLPLFVSDIVHRPDLLGTAFALNAILIVGGQWPVSKLLLRLRVSTARSVLLAFFAFAGGFALLWLLPGWQMVYAAVTLWTLGEILLMPTLDTLIAEGALVKHIQIAFVLYSVAIGTGEGLGNLFGVTLADFLLKSGTFSFLFMLLTIAALAATTITGFIAPRTGR